VAADFCGNFLDDLDGPDGLFKVRRPNLETASQTQGEGPRLVFPLGAGVGDGVLNRSTIRASELPQSLKNRTAAAMEVSP